MKRLIVPVLAGCAVLPSGAATAQLAPGYQQQSDSNIAHDQQTPDELRDRSTRNLITNKEEETLKNRAASRKVKGPQPASASDIVPGSEVRDAKGQMIGSIEAVDADGAVVVTETGKAKVPLSAFGKDNRGLLFSISKDDFNKLLVSANAASAQ
jgi:hypothetical protein